jgi:coenzyme F420-reducing hydrogenase alpha subunit
MEMACGIRVDGPLRELRRLLYCGEWIESHVLHIYMLHAPDFLGYEDAIQMAKDHGDVVQRGLKLKKIGNDIMVLLGGREIHPINVRVGGFYKVPSKKELQTLVEPLKWARDASLETIKWVATLPFPDFEQDYEYVALQHPDEYPLCEGRLVSNRGLDISIDEFLEHFEERHVEHSTSLHAVLKERGPYFVGPLARYALNFDRLTPTAKQAAKEAGLGKICNNPFKGIIVRSVETLYVCEEALRIIENYEPPDKPCVQVEPRAATGHGCSEAPRGVLYHRYEIDDKGVIRTARIIPPTSQNQTTIENDLKRFVGMNLDLADDKLKWHCEQAVRNYDPCISCSCHFLNVNLDRS